jgi:hypothetical protein
VAGNKKTNKMKSNSVSKRSLGVVLLGLLFTITTTLNTFGQNDLQFTDVKVTAENAILLYWASNSNEVYEVDYADSLIDTNTGSTTWNTLYEDYPSHGTNTFIADCGNYDIVPGIGHPKLSTMRFYRVTLTGTSTSPTNPVVAVTFPTDGSTVSGDVVFSVSANSPEVLSDVKLFIDGEEQWRSADGTNFLINTCEWLNGPHTIFAIAKSQSSIEGFALGSAITYGASVSSYVGVTFNNLISRVDLSELYFEPSLGQTQHVTAQFAANVDWTLQIQDSGSNTVRTATGSGTTLGFDWDGNNDSGGSISDGIYSYFLSAQTNGKAYSMVNNATSSSPPALTVAVADEPVELWALNPDNSSPPLPLAIYPPRTDTNGFTIFEATLSEVRALTQALFAESQSIKKRVCSSSLLAVSTTSGCSFNADNAAPSSTQSTRAPKRKPRIGVKNASGSFGICYKTYPNGGYYQEPPTGRIWPLQPIFTGLDGNAPTTYIHYFPTLSADKYESDGFAEIMKIGWTNGSYKPVFILKDDQWGPQDIQKSSLGGNSIFNTCNFGILETHGVYGSQPEIDGIKYTYLYLYDRTHGNSWVRLSDMDFGSTGKNGLRWMTILSCDMLNPGNVTSMANHGKLPDNEDLHLLLGATTPTYAVPLFGADYATNLLFNTTIWQSLQNAGRVAYADQDANPILHPQMTNKVTFRVMGYQSCINDSLFLYNDPDPNTAYQILNQTVFTPTP